MQGRGRSTSKQCLMEVLPQKPAYSNICQGMRFNQRFMIFTFFIWVAENAARADQSAIIGINLRTSPSATVGARAVGSGWEGLQGRPRPVPWAPILEEHDRLPTRGRP